jgi:putative ABC transport system permease protein
MMAFRLALSNLTGAGLRTWLNVIVLSFAFVVIIWHKGLLDAWDQQAKNDMIAWELGDGQYWQKQYDPYDPFQLNESHGQVPEELSSLIGSGSVAPILITQGTLYPSGRMKNVLIKGIGPGQKVLSIPTADLDTVGDDIPALLGSSMAEGARLKKGDLVTLRWRDKNGAYDATKIRIAGIFKTNVPTVDGGQVWIPLQKLQQMLLMPDEATLLVVKGGERDWMPIGGWTFRSQDFLLADFNKIIKTKTAGGFVLWGILMLLAMLAVFDTQVLSIFRRQKEIGTYIALGMTRGQVVTLFTVEGAMNSILAAFVGALYGIPLLALQATRGISLPVTSKDYGMAMADRIYPVYGIGLIISTVVIIMVTTTVVSYWPSRKIAKMKPTDALRGKIQ